jgi:molybdopterin-guanine dinucleotide biosynthesis protein A
MGRDKALLQRDGQSQLDYVAALLAAAVEQVFVSVRDDQSGDPERSRFNTIADRYDGIGPGSRL